MPGLPHVSGAEAVRGLERPGFTAVRRRGSHIIMRRGPSGCVRPNHRKIKVGTLAGLLRQAGISADEFIASL